jgi:hypothetical protein
MIWPFVFAQAASGNPLDAIWGVLLNLGVAGIMVILLLRGDIQPRYAVQTIQNNRDEIRDQRDELLGLYKEIQPLLAIINAQLLPAVESLAKVQTDAEAAIVRLNDVSARMEAAATRIEQGGGSMQ